MFSLKPKEGGATNPPPAQSNWVKPALIVALVLNVALGYGLYSANATLNQRMLDMRLEISQEIEEARTFADKQTTEIAADLNVVSKRMGVTAQELDTARKFAERLRLEQEQSREEMASALATKASSTDVAAVVQETTTKLAEVQQDASTKIGTVSGEVKTVAANLDATREDLAASRREITDVRSTLSEQIARNASELGELRKKGERDFFEFDIRKGKKNVFQRVADIQLELKKTDTKRQKYDVVIQVDDSRLEKKERTANEPVQFLVGRDKLRYEVVVNFVDKDRIRGYVSTPKDKVLAAERPTFRP
jgi:chromosome segregation ATPase